MLDTLNRISLTAQDNQVDKFHIETEQPTHWNTIIVTKQTEGNVKPAIRQMESHNFEANEKEDVVLVVPIGRFKENGKNEKWEGVGNLNMWKWLTLEQVDMLNKLFKATNDIALVLEKTYAQLLMTDGGLREMAVKSFRETCNELLQVILGDRNYDLIADMYNIGRTNEEINEKLNQFYMQLSKTNKKYADMIAPTCKLVYDIYGSLAVRHPRRINEDNLFAKQIHRSTRKQETEIESILAEEARNENLLTKILDYYENLDALSQEKVSEELKQICQNQVKRLFGTDALELLKFMNKESISIEMLVTKFAQLVENLTNENQRVEADQIGIFCQKIYGIERFDLGELTSWLSSDQKFELGHLIRDGDISDDIVYERIFEFYEKAEHKKKMNAQKIIESECKRFVRRMFGNEIATKLEEHRWDGNFTAQMLSAELAAYAAEIKDKKNRIKAGKSIPICNRIYLGYKGDCFCNGHSSICGPFTHECLNCADNTFGVQCEKCLDGFEGNALMGEKGCLPAERNNEFAECICNMHSSQCNENGECFSCLHNTTGNQCENCAEGFYGDATQGTVDDCIPCPCPDGGNCIINGDALIECLTCPNGTYGSTCELRLQSETTRITEIIA